ncbi:MAG: alpha/beta hydrolase family protein [Sediminibacterium sp.]
MIKWFCTFSLLFLALTAGASIDTLSVFSKGMNKPVKVLVILPDQRDTSGFPVVYLLHGYAGNHLQWLNAAPQLQQKANEMHLMLVLPDGGFGSWYFDSPVDSSYRYESFMIRELVPYIDANYTTRRNRAFRAITGLSMGGHGAYYLAIRNKEVFGAAGSICGGVDFRPFPKNWDLPKVLGPKDSHADNWNNNTVMSLVDSLKNGELKLIFDCGLDDFFFPVNKALHEKLMTKKIAHDYTERPGAHNRAYWGSSIDYQLLFFKNWFVENLNNE